MVQKTDDALSPEVHMEDDTVAKKTRTKKATRKKRTTTGNGRRKGARRQKSVTRKASKRGPGRPPAKRGPGRPSQKRRGRPAGQKPARAGSTNEDLIRLPVENETSLKYWADFVRFLNANPGKELVIQLDGVNVYLGTA